MRPHGIKGNSQEGLNRRGVRNLIRKVTHRRVLIGVVHTTLGEGCRGNTGQSDEDSTVLQKGGTQAWLVGEGRAGRPARDLASINPSCKTRSACHEETLTGITKQELMVYRVLRPYITTSLPRGEVRSSHCWLQGPHPLAGLSPLVHLVGR